MSLVGAHLHKIAAPWRGHWERWCVSSAMTESVAEEWIYNNSFSRTQVGRVGAELEWLVVNYGSPDMRLGLAEIQAILKIDSESMPAKGSVSFEAGGQLELSTAPAGSLTECLDATARDLALLRSVVADLGFKLVGTGLDDRPAVRIIDTPRYIALERSYRRYGPNGCIMMCNAASVQVNVDAGDASSGWRGWRRRWWLANRLGPVFIAMFANSPGAASTDGKSRRQLLRFRTDPTRTSPIPLIGDPRKGWTDYALDARVVGISQPKESVLLDPPRNLTMRNWLRGMGPRPAFSDDLHHHLKSVIPPVRPRGYLELRMIDAQGGDNWVVPIVTVSALLDDRRASDKALRTVESLLLPALTNDWITAARHAMTDRRLAGAAQDCMAAVIEAMNRLDIPAWVRTIVLDFADTYTFRSRCPADDRLSAARTCHITASGRSQSTMPLAGTAQAVDRRVLANTQPTDPVSETSS
ncbi:glutamate-cysteine ligase family protein [Nonomuraea sp. CA-143628]|uniref:glutamate-cysteine ligase family protein n=1 Tax=Nonomuraea sp. CA-143628 TaxID=3239997 RepID=UPI003D8B7C73